MVKLLRYRDSFICFEREDRKRLAESALLLLL